MSILSDKYLFRKDILLEVAQVLCNKCREIGQPVMEDGILYHDRSKLKKWHGSPDCAAQIIYYLIDHPEYLYNLGSGFYADWMVKN